MKQTLFFNNAKLLAEHFTIVPLLYGSVGLAYVTKETLDADDIDILIPEIFLKERWPDFKTVLKGEGYALVDEQEHTFEKDGVCYAYASIEELENFAQIPLSQIRVENSRGVCFKVLSLEQYLKVYTASSKDGYRIDVRQKKDGEKIELIKRCLENLANTTGESTEQ